MRPSRTRQSLCIGDYRFSEFEPAVDCLQRHSWLALAIDVEDAIMRVEKQRLSPDLVVVAQSHPGQFSRAAVERLHQLVPLARLVVLLGSWCESETRTGCPWPGVQRLYWHQFSAGMNRVFLPGAAGGQWDQPRTSSDAERTLTQSVATPAAAESRLVVIRASGLEAYQALADALNAHGYATSWATQNQRPSVRGHWAGIWDCEMGAANDSAQLAQFAALLRPAPVIAVMNFPRLQDCRRLQSAGAAAVLGKPFALGDLCGLLGSVDRDGAIGDISAA